MSKISNTYNRPGKDDRDYVFGADQVNASTLSTNSGKISYQIKVKRIENQDRISACTAFAFTTCFEHLIYLLCQDCEFQASPLFNYKQSLIFDSVNARTDPGTSLRSACGNARLSGVPRDTTWPYTLANFTSVPSEEAYQEAFMLSRMFTYFEVNRSRQVMKYILGDLNFMVMIGFAVFPSYDSDNVTTTGDIPYPSASEIQTGSVGGHAVAVVGWDDNKQGYLIANSYGKEWGKEGFGLIPYTYFEDENLVFEVKLLYPDENFNTKYKQFTEYCNSDQVYDVSNEKNSVHRIIIFMLVMLSCIVFAVAMFRFIIRRKQQVI